MDHARCIADTVPSAMIARSPATIAAAPTALVLRRSVRRVTPARFRRRRPSIVYQQAKLDEQRNRCYWCNDEFGAFVINSRDTVKELKLAWDHFVPYSFTGSCEDLEFVASCQ